MANIANRIIKRFHSPGLIQSTFAYAYDSEATTLLVLINAPEKKTISFALGKNQVRELSRWLQEQLQKHDEIVVLEADEK